MNMNPTLRPRLLANSWEALRVGAILACVVVRKSFVFVLFIMSRVATHEQRAFLQNRVPLLPGGFHKAAQRFFGQQVPERPRAEHHVLCARGIVGHDGDGLGGAIDHIFGTQLLFS